MVLLYRVKLKDGRVYSWGWLENNALGRPDNQYYFAKPVKIGQTKTSLSGIRLISAGSTHVLALDNNKNVWSWGGDWGPGQLGQGQGWEFYTGKVVIDAAATTLLSDIVDIAGGQAHSIAVSSTGTVYTWGADCSYIDQANIYFSGQLAIGGQPLTCQSSMTSQQLPVVAKTNAITALSNIYSVVAGLGTSFFIDNTNMVYVAGNNANGQLATGNLTSKNFATANAGISTAMFCPMVSGKKTETAICYASFPTTLKAPSALPYLKYKWYFKPTGSSLFVPLNDTTPTLPITQHGTYQVNYTGIYSTACKNCTFNKSDTLIVKEPLPSFSIQPQEVCGNTANYPFAVSGTGSFKWYTSASGQDSLGRGTSLLVPKAKTSYSVLDGDTSRFVFVEQLGSVKYKGGIVRATSSLAEAAGGSSISKIKFDVQRDVQLDSISLDLYTPFCVSPNSTLSLVLWDNKGVRKDSIAFTIPCTANLNGRPMKLPVGFKIAAGTGYVLGTGTNSASIFAFFNQIPNRFPSLIGNVITITGGLNETAQTSGYFGGFYDWVVSSSLLNACPRFKSDVLIRNTLHGNMISGNQTIAPGTAPATLTSAGVDLPSYTFQWLTSADNVLWSSINGAVSSSYAPPVLTNTTYFRRVVEDPANPDCGKDTSNAVKITISVLVGILDEHLLNAGALAYPNPTRSTVMLSWTDNGGESLIEVADLNGRVLMKEATVGGQKELNLYHLEHGMYLVKLSNAGMVKQWKIEKQR